MFPPALDAEYRALIHETWNMTNEEFYELIRQRNG